MGELFRMIVHLVNCMTTQQWLLVIAIALTIGFFCMRGLGSRSSY